jgi:serine/threonine protein kinase
LNSSIVESIKAHYKKKDSYPYPTSLKCYSITKLIGKGAFGKVALATHQLTDKPVALKIIEKGNLKEG